MTADQRKAGDPNQEGTIFDDDLAEQEFVENLSGLTPLNDEGTLKNLGDRDAVEHEEASAGTRERVEETIINEAERKSRLIEEFEKDNAYMPLRSIIYLLRIHPDFLSKKEQKAQQRLRIFWYDNFSEEIPRNIIDFAASNAFDREVVQAASVLASSQIHPEYADFNTGRGVDSNIAHLRDAFFSQKKITPVEFSESYSNDPQKISPKEFDTQAYKALRELIAILNMDELRLSDEQKVLLEQLRSTWRNDTKEDIPENIGQLAQRYNFDKVTINSIDGAFKAVIDQTEVQELARIAFGPECSAALQEFEVALANRRKNSNNPANRKLLVEINKRLSVLGLISHPEVRRIREEDRAESEKARIAGIPIQLETLLGRLRDNPDDGETIRLLEKINAEVQKSGLSGNPEIIRVRLEHKKILESGIKKEKQKNAALITKYKRRLAVLRKKLDSGEPTDVIEGLEGEVNVLRKEIVERNLSDDKHFISIERQHQAELAALKRIRKKQEQREKIQLIDELHPEYRDFLAQLRNESLTADEHSALIARSRELNRRIKELGAEKDERFITLNQKQKEWLEERVADKKRGRANRAQGEAERWEKKKSELAEEARKQQQAEADLATYEANLPRRQAEFAKAEAELERRLGEQKEAELEASRWRTLEQIIGAALQEEEKKKKRKAKAKKGEEIIKTVYEGMVESGSESGSDIESFISLPDDPSKKKVELTDLQAEAIANYVSSLKSSAEQPENDLKTTKARDHYRVLKNLGLNQHPLVLRANAEVRAYPMLDEVLKAAAERESALERLENAYQQLLNDSSEANEEALTMAKNRAEALEMLTDPQVVKLKQAYETAKEMRTQKEKERRDEETVDAYLSALKQLSDNPNDDQVFIELEGAEKILAQLGLSEDPRVVAGEKEIKDAAIDAYKSAVKSLLDGKIDGEDENLKTTWARIKVFRLENDSRLTETKKDQYDHRISKQETDAKKKLEEEKQKKRTETLEQSQAAQKQFEDRKTRVQAEIAAQRDEREQIRAAQLAEHERRMSDFRDRLSAQLIESGQKIEVTRERQLERQRTERGITPVDEQKAAQEVRTPEEAKTDEGDRADSSPASAKSSGSDDRKPKVPPLTAEELRKVADEVEVANPNKPRYEYGLTSGTRALAKVLENSELLTNTREWRIARRANPEATGSKEPIPLQESSITVAEKKTIEDLKIISPLFQDLKAMPADEQEVMSWLDEIETKLQNAETIEDADIAFVDAMSDYLGVLYEDEDGPIFQKLIAIGDLRPEDVGNGEKQKDAGENPADEVEDEGDSATDESEADDEEAEVILPNNFEQKLENLLDPKETANKLVKKLKLFSKVILGGVLDSNDHRQLNKYKDGENIWSSEVFRRFLKQLGQRLDNERQGALMKELDHDVLQLLGWSTETASTEANSDKEDNSTTDETAETKDTNLEGLVVLIKSAQKPTLALQRVMIQVAEEGAGTLEDIARLWDSVYGPVKLEDSALADQVLEGMANLPDLSKEPEKANEAASILRGLLESQKRASKPKETQSETPPASDLDDQIAAQTGGRRRAGAETDEPGALEDKEVKERLEKEVNNDYEKLKELKTSLPFVYNNFLSRVRSYANAESEEALQVLLRTNKKLDREFFKDWTQAHFKLLLPKLEALKAEEVSAKEKNVGTVNEPAKSPADEEVQVEATTEIDPETYQLALKKIQIVSRKDKEKIVKALKKLIENERDISTLNKKQKTIIDNNFADWPLESLRDIYYDLSGEEPPRERKITHRGAASEQAPVVPNVDPHETNRGSEPQPEPQEQPDRKHNSDKPARPRHEGFPELPARVESQDDVEMLLNIMNDYLKTKQTVVLNRQQLDDLYDWLDEAVTLSAEFLEGDRRVPDKANQIMNTAKQLSYMESQRTHRTGSYPDLMDELDILANHPDQLPEERINFYKNMLPEDGRAVKAVLIENELNDKARSMENDRRDRPQDYQRRLAIIRDFIHHPDPETWKKADTPKARIYQRQFYGFSVDDFKKLLERLGEPLKPVEVKMSQAQPDARTPRQDNEPPEPKTEPAKPDVNGTKSKPDAIPDTIETEEPREIREAKASLKLISDRAVYEVPSYTRNTESEIKLDKIIGELEDLDIEAARDQIESVAFEKTKIFNNLLKMDDGKYQEEVARIRQIIDSGEGLSEGWTLADYVFLLKNVRLARGRATENFEARRKYAEAAREDEKRKNEYHHIINLAEAFARDGYEGLNDKQKGAYDRLYSGWTTESFEALLHDLREPEIQESIQKHLESMKAEKNDPEKERHYFGKLSNIRMFIREDFENLEPRKKELYHKYYPHFQKEHFRQILAELGEPVVPERRKTAKPATPDDGRPEIPQEAIDKAVADINELNDQVRGRVLNDNELNEFRGSLIEILNTVDHLKSVDQLAKQYGRVARFKGKQLGAWRENERARPSIEENLESIIAGGKIEGKWADVYANWTPEDARAVQAIIEEEKQSSEPQDDKADQSGKSDPKTIDKSNKSDGVEGKSTDRPDSNKVEKRNKLRADLKTELKNLVNGHEKAAEIEEKLDLLFEILDARAGEFGEKASNVRRMQNYVARMLLVVLPKAAEGENIDVKKTELPKDPIKHLQVSIAGLKDIGWEEIEEAAERIGKTLEENAALQGAITTFQELRGDVSAKPKKPAPKPKDETAEEAEEKEESPYADLMELISDQPELSEKLKALIDALQAEVKLSNTQKIFKETVSAELEKISKYSDIELRKDALSKLLEGFLTERFIERIEKLTQKAKAA